jgi:hypothetical protein
LHLLFILSNYSAFGKRNPLVLLGEFGYTKLIMFKKALLPVLLILMIIILLAAVDRWGEMGTSEEGRIGWDRFFPIGHHH